MASSFKTYALLAGLVAGSAVVSPAFALPDLALGGTASASSETYGAASKAIDGNTNGDYYSPDIPNNSVFQSNNDGVGTAGPYAFWQDTLATLTPITDVVIFARTDSGEAARLNGFYVALRNSIAGTEQYQYVGMATPLSAANPSVDVAFGLPVLADQIRIEFAHADYLALAEVQAFDNVPVAAPEPTSLALLGGGLVACFAAARRRRRGAAIG